MIIDSHKVSDAPGKTYDVCIIGAGAAGIVLGLELAASGKSVSILESGGLDFDADINDLSIGEIGPRHYDDLNVCRLRYLGGTTNHWGGWCRPFSDIELQHRDWIPLSGWPFDNEHLAKYYPKASKYCQLKTDSFDPSSAAKSLNDPATVELPLSETSFDTTIYRFSPPTRFGEEYLEGIKQATNIDLYLNANVLNLELSHDANSVKNVNVGTLSDVRFGITAKRFVLATGGLENARLLLLSNNVATRGIGNQHDLVGRYFMEHAVVDIGVLAPSSDFSLNFYNSRIGYHELGFVGSFQLNDEAQIKERINSARVDLTGFSEGESSDGAKSLKKLMYEVRQGRWPDDLGKHLRNIAVDIDDVAKAVYGHLTSEARDAQFYSAQLSLEQEPNPSSRVELSTQKDALGLNQIKLDWRLTKNDYRTVEKTAELFAQSMGAANIGRVRLDIDKSGLNGWPEDLAWGWHHMGTTRMSDDPTTGVVDRQCRVHGVENLYVAGSSVFPTSGAGVPTLTIVALAIRLADHLNEKSI